MIRIFTDGSCRPNPGKGGIGVVIQSDNWAYTISDVCTQKCTNNLAEYLAVRRALEELINNELMDEEIVINSDSEMLVLQMTDEKKVDKGGSYVPVYNEVKELLKKFSNVAFKWIPRCENSEANLLASKAV